MLRRIALLLVLGSVLTGVMAAASEPIPPASAGSIAVSVSGPAKAPVLNLRTDEKGAWSVPLRDGVQEGSVTVSRSVEDPDYTVITILADAPPAPRAERSAGSGRPAL
jgi:hypothetical protein